VEEMNMANNAWSKLITVSLVGIVISFVLLWGIGEFSRYNGYGNMNMGYGYQMNGMQMWPQNGMMGYNNFTGMNMQGMPNQRNRRMGGMNGYMQGGMGAMGGMNGYMQGGMNGNMGW
jgi:hypothetical protein